MSSHRYFICSCSGNMEEAEKVYERALDHLGGGTKGLIPQAGERYFVTHTVQSLWWDHGIEIKGMPNDQWSAVVAKRIAQDGDEEISYYIECDKVEHGLAYLLMDAPKTPEAVAEYDRTP